MNFGRFAKKIVTKEAEDLITFFRSGDIYEEPSTIRAFENLP